MNFSDDDTFIINGKKITCPASAELEEIIPTPLENFVQNVKEGNANIEAVLLHHGKGVRVKCKLSDPQIIEDKE